MKLFFYALSLIYLIASAHADPVMVFDAGSSGSRVYLYDVTTDAEGRINVTTLGYYKGASPYSYPVTDAKFAADPVGYFNHFLEKIEAAAPQTPEAQAKTPIYVYATAGVRMSETPAPQDIIDDMREGIRTAAADKGRLYPAIPDASIDTLSVADEAFNVWINDQYVSGKLIPNQLHADEMYAAIEMGGASSEVSILTTEPSEFNMTFMHLGQPYDVYSTGYDGSGQDKARDAMLQAYQANPIDKEKFAGCFPVGAPYPSQENAMLEGTGVFADCVAFIEAHPVNHYDAQTPTAKKYLLTSGFYYTFKTLGIANETVLQETTNTELAKAGTAFCGKSWAELQAAYPGDTYLITYCFNSAFQHSFLNEMNVAPEATLLSIDKYNGKPMTWTLGVAYP